MWRKISADVYGLMNNNLEDDGRATRNSVEEYQCNGD